MTFEELSTKDIPTLPLDHPARFMEDRIKKELLPKKPAHDKEHDDMCKHWSLPIREDQPAIITMKDGHSNRFYHIALHARYWKEKGLNAHVVEEFEEKLGLDPLTVPLPVL